MAELTYRDAVARGIAQEMERDERVVFLGEDIGKAGGVFKTTVGLYEKFGPRRVRDTPISEQAILGAAMGAAMTGLRPIAEIMFSDFLAVCFDYVANRNVEAPIHVERPARLPAGDPHGQRRRSSLRSAAFSGGRKLDDDDPGHKSCCALLAHGRHRLMAAAVRDPDPVIFHEHKALYAIKGDVPDGEIVDQAWNREDPSPG